MHKIKNRQWAIFKTSAIKGEGLFEGLDWYALLIIKAYFFFTAAQRKYFLASEHDIEELSVCKIIVLKPKNICQFQLVKEYFFPIV